MRIPVQKGTFQISYIQCGSWHSSNLLSDGLSVEASQDGSTAVITFCFDTSINQKTKNKDTSAYLDSIELAEKIDAFQYLTISDDKIIRILSGKIKNMSSKIRCLLEIIVTPDGSRKKFAISPTVSGEVKLTRTDIQ